ncbi:MAG TPA: aminotransferase class V-fold PLP-dependent enzyme [Methanomicrobiales archaeon]|jgi:cysteine desulfurase/selenocysteine lyase|nr:aminotransferase class V-fold PLP-dependent enzyme [Methanomicrobiales archaeon]
MHEPPVKKVLYWCDRCNVPLIARTCGCGAEGRRVPLQAPYDVRPALAADLALLRGLVEERFGPVPVPKIVLLNKAGGVDRNDLVIIHGERFGWLSFDPVSRLFRFDLAPGGLPFVVGPATRGIVDLEEAAARENLDGRRIGGKRIPVKTGEPEGTLVVKYRNGYGTGVLRAGQLRVKEIQAMQPRSPPDPGWEIAVGRNRYHLKNLERNAIREIRQHLKDRPCANVSFSGGKDSMAAMALARKAGIPSAFFIDTGIEFPETVRFVEEQGVEIVRKGGDFWAAAEKAGPPAKDMRWCCKLLKLHPLRLHLAITGPCVTVQGNRWYESWNRADLEATSQNPANPLQLNISPIRNWRALEVFLYLWWRNLPVNPLYGRGIERIGCYLCPAMLESEQELLRGMHPGLAQRWDEFLDRWAATHDLPEEYARWGLWRWRDLPPKMRELCGRHGVALDGDRLKPVTRRAVSPSGVKKPAPVHAEEAVAPGTGASLRADFPLIADLVYLDSATTGVSPEPVIEAMLGYERHYRANVGRGVHRLSQVATQKYWDAHEKVKRFIGAREGDLVFTRDVTEAVTMVAEGLAWKPGDRVVTTMLEESGNFVPWLHLREKGVECDVLPVDEKGTVDPVRLGEVITGRTRLVAVTQVSGVLGSISPVQEIGRICREHGALLLVDGTHSVPRLPTGVSSIGCDFFCFAGDRMGGPTGIGVLWMKNPAIGPLYAGGGMVGTVSGKGFTLAEGYQRYEAGTPNVAAGIGLGVAADYLAGIGMGRIHDHERRLSPRLIDGLRCLPGVSVYGPADPERRTGIVSFTIEGMDPRKVAVHLDEASDILVGAGHHDCQILMERLGLPGGTVRAGVSPFTTEQEVDLLVATVAELVKG